VVVTKVVAVVLLGRRAGVGQMGLLLLQFCPFFEKKTSTSALSDRANREWTCPGQSGLSDDSHLPPQWHFFYGLVAAG